MHTQNGILAAVQVIAKMENGDHKEEAKVVLTHFRKSDESMRKRLFILQVWRKHGRDVAAKLASRKAGELLDPDLANILKGKQKIEEKIQRDLAKDRAVTQQQAKRFKYDYGAGHSNYNRGGQSRGNQHRGGYTRGGGGYTRGGEGYGRGAGTKQSTTKEEKKCYSCNSAEHFARNCPTRK